jgi:type III pantothenate kinase
MAAMGNTFPRLLIDAGNSRIKWRLLDAAGAQINGQPVSHSEAQARDNTPDTRPALPEALSAAWAGVPRPASIWISNVAGAAVAAQLGALLDHCWPGSRATTIRAQPAQCGVVNGYAMPEKLGSDRWAGMIAARGRHPNDALLIATLGTATTLDVIDGQGRFIGGLIAPGWTLMMRSLGEHTAQLSALMAAEAPAATGAPASNIGAGTLSEGAPVTAGHDADFFATTTSRAIIDGCRLAQAGLIDSAWRNASAQFGTAVHCIMSGGAAEEVARAVSMPYSRHDDLVLDGLALIAQDTLGV